MEKNTNLYISQWQAQYIKFYISLGLYDHIDNLGIKGLKVSL